MEFGGVTESMPVVLSGTLESCTSNGARKQDGVRKIANTLFVHNTNWGRGLDAGTPS